MVARRRLLIPFLVASALAGVLVAVLVGRGIGDGDGSGGRPPHLDVAQDASADDQGVQLSVNAAAFSGTATFLAMSVEIDPVLGPAVRVHVPPDALVGSAIGVEPGSQGFGAAPGAESLVRLGPLPVTGDARLTIRKLNLVREDGSSVTLTGNWTLDLKTPDDLRARLRVEQLTGTSASAGPVRLSVQGAIRSTSETLVTVLVDSDEPLEPLGQPTIVAGGELLFGGLVREEEQGRLLTYAFPPTTFGSKLEVRFMAFVRRGASVAGSVTVDLGAAIRRENAGRTVETWFPVAPGDALATSGAGLTVTAMQFERDDFGTRFGGTAHIIRVRLAGAYEDLRFSLVGADGEPLALGPALYGYGTDASGVISNPRTELWIGYNELDQIMGPVTITYAGASQEIVRGDWTIVLSP